ncbi:LacI family DNA-binding transcriptional regulator [Neorhodopirellula pilleata]|uniref:HTH-type transcriptional regulator AscG n=1 Tax=Neorhodopirellula pilleata TaxID=2714738 RepID=A0A5C6ARL7_9BACT|nr:LacI family DNA-binding transcriptional regulator [Neorhodopirellula pilleata]TWU01889.1 HTH-type transcriptional regulator AscG [Neorhodopirellula pilleata]
MAKSVNQQVIADRLNLSRATVSRCFTNHPGINPETRGKVFKLAAALGYNHLEQRQGKPRRSPKNPRFLVLICTRLEEYLDQQYESPGERLLAGVSDFAQRRNRELEIHYVSPGDSEIDDPSYAAISSLQKNASAGALLIYPFPQSIVDELGTRMPVVSLVEQYSGIPVNCVDVDHHRGIAAIVRQLASLGHYRIGFLTQRYEVDANWALRRHSAYVEEMLRLGLALDPANELNVRTGEQMSLEQLHQAALQRTRYGVTAWVCAADHEAYGLIKFFKKNGVRVPRDVSVTGFDGIEPPKRLPTLTTAQIPYYEIGQIGAQRLQDLVNKRFGSAQHIMLDCLVREGKSTGPPPK